MVLPRPTAAEPGWGQLSVLGVGWLRFCAHMIARVRRLTCVWDPYSLPSLVQGWFVPYSPLLGASPHPVSLCVIVLCRDKSLHQVPSTLRSMATNLGS